MDFDQLHFDKFSDEYHLSSVIIYKVQQYNRWHEVFWTYFDVA